MDGIEFVDVVVVGVPRAVRVVEDWERSVIEASRPEGWTLERMKQAYQSPRRTWPDGKARRE